MSAFKTFAKAGHWPTLFAAFLYFDFCFAIWVLNGAMAPFISESFGLTPAQKGFMISVPILAGALMRFPLGVLAQYIGRKNAALVEMSLIVAALGFGFFLVDSYDAVLAMGVLLGIAGASFGVALSLGSGWYPAKYKGLAMGIAGAGNSGTVLAVLFAPPLAQKFGWQAVYGIAAATMLLPMLVMALMAKEPPDVEHQSFRQHIGCLFEKDGWAFSLIYIVTFGGFIGLASFLPTYFYDQFKVSKVEAGQLTMLATLMGSAVRVVGGALSDRIGGVHTLSGVLLLSALSLVACGFAGGSLVGHHAVLHAVLRGLRGRQRRAVPAGAAALAAEHRGGRLDDRRGRCTGRRLHPQRHGPEHAAQRQLPLGLPGLRAAGAGHAGRCCALVQIRWTRTWAEKGGRARVAPAQADEEPVAYQRA
jgi:NNP family nitrate/nitrite transporter-like MFS transporter